MNEPTYIDLPTETADQRALVAGYIALKDPRLECKAGNTDWSNKIGSIDNWNFELPTPYWKFRLIVAPAQEGGSGMPVESLDRQAVIQKLIDRGTRRPLPVVPPAPEKTWDAREARTCRIYKAKNWETARNLMAVEIKHLRDSHAALAERVERMKSIPYIPCAICKGSGAIYINHKYTLCSSCQTTPQAPGNTPE